jgi:O-antigen/teichoic acid export membrane protein
LSLARRLIRNTFANWIGLGVGALASFILAPYLIGHLGPERFGLYQISRQFVAYLILFDLGILGAVMRFCADGVAAGNHLRVNAVANSAMVVYAAIAIAGLALCIAAGHAAPDFFRVDPAYVEETRLLFWGLGLWWAVTMLGYPARGILIAHQRYDLLALINASGWVLLVVIIIAVFEIGYVDLVAIAAAFAVGGLLQLIAFNLAARRTHAPLQWSGRHVSTKTLRGLGGFGSWNLLFTIAGLFLWSTDSIVIGRVLGAAVVPFYAIPFMLITHGHALVRGFSAPLTPAAAALGVQDPSRLGAMLLRGTRIAVILVLASNGLLIVLAKDLFRLWIGPEYAASWAIYACLVASFWLVGAHLPSYNILLGAGDIRRPAAAVLLATTAALVMKIAVAPDAGLMGVALANLICLLPVMGIYLPYCACRLARISLADLYRQAYLPPILGFAPVAALGSLAVHYRPPNNLFELVVYLGGLVTVYLLLAFHFLDADERATVLGILRRATRLLAGGRSLRPGSGA